jgi:hypothetical protein
LLVSTSCFLREAATRSSLLRRTLEVMEEEEEAVELMEEEEADSEIFCTKVREKW